AQLVPPARGDRLEIRVVMRGAARVRRLETVAGDRQQIERQADLDVGLESRMERDQQKHQRVLETHRAVVAADQDGAAVLRLADLEEGRVEARLDEVAFGIDQEQARLHALDLSRENDRGGEAAPPPIRVRLLPFLDRRAQQ